MSRELLTFLNGGRQGEFARWLRSAGNPRIAWYPSAGEDFRDLLYLSPHYQAAFPAEGEEPESPTLFLHTDYFPWEISNFLDSPRLYKDADTEVTLMSLEELPSLGLPVKASLVHFPRGSVATNRVVFLQIRIRCKKLGEFTQPLLYAFCENAAFFAKVLLKYNARLSHVVRVRYGNGLGGGYSSGKWLFRALEPLGAELYVGNEERPWADDRPLEAFPSMVTALSPETPNMSRIRTIPSRSWSGCGDVEFLRTDFS